MTGSAVVRRYIRTPALALMAAAGLVVWGGGDGWSAAGSGAVPTAYGHVSLARSDAGESAALRSGGAGGAWAPLEQTERHRQGPTGSSDGATAVAASGAAGLFTRGSGDAALHLGALRAHSRAGLDAAPSTGPPFLPL